MITKKFKKAFILTYAVAILIAFLISSYSVYSITSVLSFGENDGWCKPASEGFGTHCFGDYYYPINLISKSFPWSGSPNPYPPLAIELYRPFKFIADITSARVGLNLYLLMLIILVIAPVFILARKLVIKNDDFSVFTLATVGSAPMVVALDRGNSAVLLFPILLFWILSIRNSNYRRSTNLAILACLLRPQFIIINIIYIFLGRRKDFYRVTMASGLGICLSFLIYGRNSVSNILHWIIHVLTYQDYAHESTIYPVNISFANSIQLITSFIGIDINPVFITIFTYTSFGIVIFVFSRKQRQIPLYLKINAALLAPIFFIGTTFHYYLFAVSLILFNSLLQEEKPIELSRKSGLIRKLNQFTEYALFVCALIPWVLPWGLVPGVERFITQHFPKIYAPEGWSSISMQWILVEAILVAYAVFIFCVYPFSRDRIIK